MIEFASKEELYFSWWLDELEKERYIQSWTYQPKPFTITQPVFYRWTKKLKTKNKVMKSTLLQGYSYQADFMIIWDFRGRKVFYDLLYDGIMTSKKEDYPFVAQIGINSGKTFSVVDVKGNFSQNDAYRRFSIDQKLVWNKHRIYVQKIIPVPSVKKDGKLVPANALFAKTFTPDKYRFTDKTGKLRLIRYPLKSIEEYLRDINYASN